MKRQHSIQRAVMLSGIAAYLAAMAQGCAVHPVRKTAPLPLSTPEQFRDAGLAEAPDRWWEAFGSPGLNALVETALEDNLDIRSAWARLAQFGAAAKASGAQLYPLADFGAEASRSGAESVLGSSPTNRFGFSLLAQYEVDLWRRIDSRRNAATLDAAATAEDAAAIAMTLSGLVAEHWFSIIELDMREKLLREQLETSQTFLALNELRFGQGLASAVDVYQQRGQVASIEAQFPAVRTNREALENRLRVLLGKPPGGGLEWIPEAYPETPPRPSPGTPPVTLLKRPDVRAAQLRVAAADHRVAAAVADRLPAVRLSAQGGFQSGQIGDLFSATLWGLASNLTAPVFDGHARAAEVERTKAVVEERLVSLEQTVLNALLEIENAMALERGQWESIAAAERQLDVAERTLSESQNRFLNGLGDYLPVLTALSETQRLERELIALRREALLRRVDLYAALGGSWTTEWRPSVAAGRNQTEGESAS